MLTAHVILGGSSIQVKKMPSENPLVKVTLRPGYRRKLQLLAMLTFVGRLSVATYLSALTELFIDWQIARGAIPPISQEDIDKDMLMNTKEQYQDLRIIASSLEPLDLRNDVRNFISERF